MAEDDTAGEERRERFRKFAGLELDEVVRKDELAQFAFEDCRAVSEVLRNLATATAELPWEILPDSLWRSVNSALGEVERALQSLLDFSPVNAGGDPMRQRDGLANQLRTQIENLQEALVPNLGYLQFASLDIDQIRKDIDYEVKRLQDETQRVKEEAAATQAEAKRMLDDIREISVEAAVANRANEFESAREENDKRGWIWLTATIVLGVATALGGSVAFLAWGYDGQIDDGAFLRGTLARTFAIVIGVYFTVSAAKLYRSHAHLAAVNQHRVHALRTYRAFANGTETTEVKDKVLLEAAHTIFAPPTTGLIDGTEGGSTVEILDAALGSRFRSN